MEVGRGWQKKRGAELVKVGDFRAPSGHGVCGVAYPPIGLFCGAAWASLITYQPVRRRHVDSETSKAKAPPVGGAWSSRGCGAFSETNVFERNTLPRILEL